MDTAVEFPPFALRVLLDVRGGFGAERMVRTHRDDHGIWTGRSGLISFRWSGASPARRSGARPLALELTLTAGQVHDLVLELATGRLDAEPVSAATAWEKTEHSWRDAVPCWVTTSSQSATRSTRSRSSPA